METHSPSLGDKIARLRDTAHAQEKCAWLPDAIHALIIACLARIFDRLEQIILLWQAGDLPLPPTRCPAQHSPASAPRPSGAKSTVAGSHGHHENPQEKQRFQRQTVKVANNPLARLRSCSWRPGVGITDFYCCRKSIAQTTPGIPANPAAPPARSHHRSARAPPIVKPAENASRLHSISTPYLLLYANDIPSRPLPPPRRPI